MVNLCYNLEMVKFISRTLVSATPDFRHYLAMFGDENTPEVFLYKKIEIKDGGRLRVDIAEELHLKTKEIEETCFIATR